MISLLSSFLSTATALAAPYELPPRTASETLTLLTSASPARAVSDLYNFALGIGAIAAFGLIVYSALQYTTTDSPGKRQEAQGRIFQSLLGLLLLIGATVVLRFINPDLPQLKDPNAERLGTITVEGGIPEGETSYWTIQVCPKPGDCTEEDYEDLAPREQGRYTDRDSCVAMNTATGEEPARWRCVERLTGQPSALVPVDTSVAEQREEAVREQLRQAGIPVNKRPCVPYGSRYQDNPGGCTNIGGVPNYVIDKLIVLNREFRIRISGGSEAGHASHGINLPVVDLTPNFGGTPTANQWCELERRVRELGVEFMQLENLGVRVESCRSRVDHLHVKFN